MYMLDFYHKFIILNTYYIVDVWFEFSVMYGVLGRPVLQRFPNFHLKTSCILMCLSKISATKENNSVIVNMCLSTNSIFCSASAKINAD